MSGATVSAATREAEELEAIERELANVARLSAKPTALDRLRQLLPQANGDQDTW